MRAITLPSVSSKKAIHTSRPGRRAARCGCPGWNFTPRLGVGGVDLRDVEIENRAPVGELRLLRDAHQQADAAALEEAHLRGRVEQVADPQGIAVEGGGARELAGVDGNLLDRGETGHFGHLGRGVE
jgi:hypothetical protein